MTSLYKEHILGERDEEVRDCVHLSFGEGLALGQSVHRVEGGVQQCRGVVGVTEEMTVVCQDGQHTAPNVAVQSQGHVILRRIYLLQRDHLTGNITVI